MNWQGKAAHYTHSAVLNAVGTSMVARGVGRVVQVAGRVRPVHPTNGAGGAAQLELGRTVLSCAQGHVHGDKLADCQGRGRDCKHSRQRSSLGNARYSSAVFYRT